MVAFCLISDPPTADSLRICKIKEKLGGGEGGGGVWGGGGERFAVRGGSH